jgi:hypothetical protein
VLAANVEQRLADFRATYHRAMSSGGRNEDKA